MVTASSPQAFPGGTEGELMAWKSLLKAPSTHTSGTFGAMVVMAWVLLSWGLGSQWVDVDVSL